MGLLYLKNVGIFFFFFFYSVLTNVFQPDLPVGGGNTLGPKVSDFMKIVMPKLEILYTLSPAVDLPAKIGNLDQVVHGVGELKLGEKKNGLVLPDDATSAALRLFKTSKLIFLFKGFLPCYFSIRDTMNGSNFFLHA